MSCSKKRCYKKRSRSYRSKKYVKRSGNSKGKLLKLNMMRKFITFANKYRKVF